MPETESNQPSIVTPQEAQKMMGGATEGPWRWFGNTAGRQIYLATVDRGRQFVLSFYRWGMQGATPAFRGDGHMENAEHFARYEVAPDATEASDRRLYRQDFQGLRHPDAVLIEAAPRLARTVATEPDRTRAAVVKALLDAGRAIAEDMNLVSYKSGIAVETFLERRAGAIENGADY